MSDEKIDLPPEYWDEYMEWWREHKRTAYETFVVEVPTPPGKPAAVRVASSEAPD